MVSIVNQHFKDLKVIVIDDSDENHPNLKENYLNKYMKDLCLEYYPRRNNGYTCHCPGNTRHDGLIRALEEDTKYIFFADCDDEFEPNCLLPIHDKLEEIEKQLKHPAQVLLTPFWAWSEDSQTQLNLEKNNIAWIHGKFYNKDFLFRNNIQFRPNFLTHEDVYFNTTINCFLTKENTDFIVFDFIFYKWYHREKSESHKKAYATGQNFLEEHFQDFIETATLPILQIKEIDPVHEHQYGINAMNAIVTSYFYFQGFLSCGNPDYFKRNYELCKWQALSFIKTFRFNKDTIIALVQEHPEIYNTDRNECIKGTGLFVETQSFADYLRDMCFYK